MAGRPLFSQPFVYLIFPGPALSMSLFQKDRMFFFTHKYESASLSLADRSRCVDWLSGVLISSLLVTDVIQNKQTHILNKDIYVKSFLVSLFIILLELLLIL